MTIAMPRVVQTPTHAYNPAPIVHDKVFVHMAEGGSAGGVAWLCSGNVQASTHLFMNEDGTVVYQLVPLGAKAWAECEFNGQGISMEIPGFTAKGIPDARWRAAALIVAWLCREYGIPPAWAKGGAGRGVCQHVDLGEAGGGHHDACGIGSQTWLTFMGYVKEAFDAFGPEALPPFALHGAPELHTTELPPNAPPEPSHGGAARSASGEEPVLHPTPSGYAHGSVKDVQWRLIKAGYSIGDGGIDGQAGPDTRAAIAKFQADHGLAGALWPKVSAALDAATGAAS